MVLYGMKDAANLILRDKETGLPALYIGYANATSTEWASDQVYATAKGTNAIRWDNSRTGTLTVDTEVFDLGLLAMVMGSGIKEGSITAMERRDAVLNESLSVSIGDGIGIDGTSIQAFRLERAGDSEHVGLPLFNQSTSESNLPPQVTNVSVTTTDTSARVTFDRINNATGYLVFRNGAEIADTVTATYTDTTVEPSTAYTYTVRAYNDFGQGPESAVVSVTTGEEGTEDEVMNTATTEAITEAAGNTGIVEGPDSGAVTFSYNAGVVTFSNANPGDAYAIYFMERVDRARTLTVGADTFAGAYEIYGDARIRPQSGTADELIRIHYPNARPQSNFTLTQSATEPTSLSIVFDLFPETNEDGESVLAEFHFIK